MPEKRFSVGLTKLMHGAHGGNSSGRKSLGLFQDKSLLPLWAKHPHNSLGEEVKGDVNPWNP